MPEPGDFAVVKTHGLAAWLIRLATHSTVNHAFLSIGGDAILEADPRTGITPNNASTYATAVWANYPLTELQQAEIVQWAKNHIGVRYGFLDLVALFLARDFGWRTPNWVLKRVNRPDRLICSQFVDAAYQAAGIHLFSDGRPPSDITPADLDLLIREDSWQPALPAPPA